MIDKLASQAVDNMNCSTQMTKEAAGFFRRQAKIVGQGLNDMIGHNRLAGPAIGGAVLGGLVGSAAGGLDSTAASLGMGLGLVTAPIGVAHMLGSRRIGPGLGIIGAGLGIPAIVGIGERIVRPIMYERQKEEEYQQALLDIQEQLDI